MDTDFHGVFLGPVPYFPYTSASSFFSDFDEMGGQIQVNVKTYGSCCVKDCKQTPKCERGGGQDKILGSKQDILTRNFLTGEAAKM